MKIISSNTPAATAGAALSHILEQYVGKPILLLLSGGSALKILDHVSEDVLSSQLTVSTLDERFSTDPLINNFAQIKATEFYSRVQARGGSFIDTSLTARDSLGEAAERFSKALQDWRERYSDGVVIATMGMGSDGHTAGILPGKYGVNFSGDAMVVAYEVPESVNPYTKRITVTYSFLRTQVKEVLLYVTGAEKKSVLQKIDSEECALENTPACILKELSTVTLVTDIL